MPLSDQICPIASKPGGNSAGQKAFGASDVAPLRLSVEPSGIGDTLLGIIVWNATNVNDLSTTPLEYSKGLPM
jgi:hypothetical protein